jgi:hypothetical protein
MWNQVVCYYFSGTRCNLYEIKMCEIGSACSTLRGMHTKFLYETLKEINHYEDLDVDGRAVLKWILKKYDGRVRTGFIWHGIRQAAASSKCSNESSSSMMQSSHILCEDAFLKSSHNSRQITS